MVFYVIQLPKITFLDIICVNFLNIIYRNPKSMYQQRRSGTGNTIDYFYRKRLSFLSLTECKKMKKIKKSHYF